MNEDSTLQKIKKYTAYGIGFLTLLGVISGIGMLTTKSYAFAQKVEVYVGLPKWLERIETKIDTTLEKVGSIEDRLKTLEDDKNGLGR